MELIEITENAEELLDAICAIDEEIFSGNPWGREAFAENAANSYDRLFAAVEDGTVCGYAILRLLYDAELLRIAVDRNNRRRGTGSLLMKMILAAAHEGAGCILLEVREGNAPARRMYEKCGFSEEGLRKDYYSEPKENAVIMRYVC